MHAVLCIDAAYCYRRSVAFVSVCVSVGHNTELCENG